MRYVFLCAVIGAEPDEIPVPLSDIKPTVCTDIESCPVFKDREYFAVSFGSVDSGLHARYFPGIQDMQSVRVSDPYPSFPVCHYGIDYPCDAGECGIVSISLDFPVIDYNSHIRAGQNFVPVKLHALHLLVVRTVAFEAWSHGVSVIIEKSFICAYPYKSRTVLIYVVYERRFYRCGYLFEFHKRHFPWQHVFGR